MNRLGLSHPCTLAALLMVLLPGCAQFEPSRRLSSAASPTIRAAGADEFYLARLQSGQDAYRSKRFAEAADELRIASFGFRGHEAHECLHVCGEAYSDYQGFIEGALRSTLDAVGAISPQ